MTKIRHKCQLNTGHLVPVQARYKLFHKLNFEQIVGFLNYVSDAITNCNGLNLITI